VVFVTHHIKNVREPEEEEQHNMLSIGFKIQKWASD